MKSIGSLSWLFGLTILCLVREGAAAIPSVVRTFYPLQGDAVNLVQLELKKIYQNLKTVTPQGAQLVSNLSNSGKISSPKRNLTAGQFIVFYRDEDWSYRPAGGFFSVRARSEPCTAENSDQAVFDVYADAILQTKQLRIIFRFCPVRIVQAPIGKDVAETMVLGDSYRLIQLDSIDPNPHEGAETTTVIIEPNRAHGEVFSHACPRTSEEASKMRITSSKSFPSPDGKFTLCYKLPKLELSSLPFRGVPATFYFLKSIARVARNPSSTIAIDVEVPKFLSQQRVYLPNGWRSVQNISLLDLELEEGYGSSVVLYLQSLPLHGKMLDTVTGRLLSEHDLPVALNHPVVTYVPEPYFYNAFQVRGSAAFHEVSNHANVTFSYQVRSKNSNELIGEMQNISVLIAAVESEEQYELVGPSIATLRQQGVYSRFSEAFQFGEVDPEQEQFPVTAQIRLINNTFAGLGQDKVYVRADMARNLSFPAFSLSPFPEVDVSLYYLLKLFKLDMNEEISLYRLSQGLPVGFKLSGPPGAIREALISLEFAFVSVEKDGKGAAFLEISLDSNENPSFRERKIRTMIEFCDPVETSCSSDESTSGEGSGQKYPSIATQTLPMATYLAIGVLGVIFFVLLLEACSRTRQRRKNKQNLSIATSHHPKLVLEVA